MRLIYKGEHFMQSTFFEKKHEKSSDLVNEVNAIANASKVNTDDATKKQLVSSAQDKGTMAIIPNASQPTNLPRYGVTITYKDIKQALDLYDKEKDVFEKIGVGRAPIEIMKLRNLFKFLSDQSNLSNILDSQQLFALAKCTYTVDCTYTSGLLVDSVRNINELFGYGRYRAWYENRSRNSLDKLKLNCFMAFFDVDAEWGEYVFELIPYYERFPFLREFIKENSTLVSDLLHLLEWLRSRKILTEINVRAMLCHIDAMYLYMDVSNRETQFHASFSTKNGTYMSFIRPAWQAQETVIRDPVFQQMLFETIIKRAADKKAVAVLQGLKEKSSMIHKFFGANTSGEPNDPLGEPKVLKEVFSFLRFSTT